ncbi:MAG: SRPBCC domain-containing protein [Gammaproteobacteria bacterium]|nr:SRPBCC domain-containing protein [Gammaproteobacteria bacterium]
MKIAKTFRIAAPIDRVWPTITDPEQVASCLPGCEQVDKVDELNYKALVKVVVGPIRTQFKVDIACVEQRPPEYAAYETKGEEGGKSSRVKAISTLTLASLSEEETEVSYSSDLSIIGRLGKFGSGMMLKVADSMGDDFVAALKGVIEGQQVDAGPKTMKTLNRAFWIGGAILVAAFVIIALLLA